MAAIYRGSIEQKARLTSGLILFTFALTHFLNHALGLYGVEAMQEADKWRLYVTRSTIGGIVLAGAAITHILLALKKLALRSTLKMPVWEMAQVILGLSIPLLLIPHMVSMRLSYELFGIETTYFNTLLTVWQKRPYLQSVLLLIVWCHACIGLHFWLRLSDWYVRAFQVMFALAVIIPLAGIAGYMVSGRALEAKTIVTAQYGNSPGRSSDYDAPSTPDYGNYGEVKETNGNNPGQTLADQRKKILELWIDRLSNIFLSLLGLTTAIYTGRQVYRRLGANVVVSYACGPTIRTTAGPALLEISRQHSIPHASVCGGRGRCSTCRVRIEDGADALGPPDSVEERTLASVNAGPNDRLACQIRPSGKLSVIRIIQPTQEAFTSKDFSGSSASGEERELAVLFLDVRGFTAMSAGKLPYDVVFVLNQLFDATGEAIQANGGWIDKYLGDGLMAVFGKESSARVGSRQALRAVRDIDLALDRVNATIGRETGGVIRLGMGLHVGPMILGEIGHSGSAAMTVIGRTVNTASRLEKLTKTKGCQLVISADVVTRADLAVFEFPKQTVEVRGIPEPIDVYCLARARELPEVFSGQDD